MTKNSATPLTASQRRNNRIKLMVLWLIPFGLMAIAGFCYYLVQSGQMTVTSKNHGNLIQPPLQLNELLEKIQHKDSSGQPLDLDTPWQGQWTMVVRGDVDGAEQCSQRCRDNLYATRQLHIRLDKNANRVQRVYLTHKSNVDADLSAFLQEEHRLTKFYVADEESLASLDSALRTPSGEAASFFLVDPAGWAMMFYSSEHSGNGMLKDLKHLLKYSRDR